MSGTSLDGIDVSLIETDGNFVKRLNKNYYHPYKASTKRKFLKLVNKDLKEIKKTRKYFDELINNEHFEALQNCKILNECEYVSFHGQTVYHDSITKTSIQLGDGKNLSKLIKKTVISNFRDNDLKNGGQGAPLSPIYHQNILQNLKLDLPSCVLNIGGVANVTYWDSKNLIGFDTGPGNSLMDDYIKLKLGKYFDNKGYLASQGSIYRPFIQKFLDSEFFYIKGPKSLDRNSFKTNFEDLVKKNLSIPDSLATLAECTVKSILLSLESLPQKPKNIIIVGGGYKNNFLLQRLIKNIDIRVIREDEIELDFDFIESELIAFLGARSIKKLPITFPSTTGVKKPLCGGKIYKYI